MTKQFSGQKSKCIDETYLRKALTKSLATRTASGSWNLPVDTSRILSAVGKSHPAYETLILRRVLRLKSRTGNEVLLAKILGLASSNGLESSKIARI